MNKAKAQAGGFTDTKSDINPTPRQNTELGLRVLKRWIDAYRTKTGHLPNTLEEIVPPDVGDSNLLPHQRFYQDGWNRQFTYTRAGDTYELRSLGDDGRPSGDDIVVRGGPGRAPR